MGNITSSGFGQQGYMLPPTSSSGPRAAFEHSNDLYTLFCADPDCAAYNLTEHSNVNAFFGEGSSIRLVPDGGHGYAAGLIATDDAVISFRCTDASCSSSSSTSLALPSGPRRSRSSPFPQRSSPARAPAMPRTPGWLLPTTSRPAQTRPLPPRGSSRTAQTGRALRPRATRLWSTRSAPARRRGSLGLSSRAWARPTLLASPGSLPLTREQGPTPSTCAPMHPAPRPRPEPGLPTRTSRPGSLPRPPPSPPCFSTLAQTSTSLPRRASGSSSAPTHRVHRLTVFRSAPSRGTTARWQVRSRVTSQSSSEPTS